jgi:hypothetical protein
MNSTTSPLKRSPSSKKQRQNQKKKIETTKRTEKHGEQQKEIHSQQILPLSPLRLCAERKEIRVVCVIRGLNLIFEISGQQMSAATRRFV